MNVIIIKDWFNPDTKKWVKKGSIIDLIDWKIKELQLEGIIQIPDLFTINDTTQEELIKEDEAEFVFEEITEPKKKKTYF
jgi:hypothetical protein